MAEIARCRSIMVAGRKTSVSLEDAFWDGLREIARSQRMEMSTLVTAVAATRKQKNLSSTIRLFVPDYFRGERADLPPRPKASNDKSQSTQA